METPRRGTVRVLAAKGKLVIHTVGGKVRRRSTTDESTGRPLSVAVYISDGGIWDGRLRKVIVPGPVTVDLDARTRRLLLDGDLVEVKSEPAAAPAPAPEAGASTDEPKPARQPRR